MITNPRTSDEKRPLGNLRVAAPSYTALDGHTHTDTQTHIQTQAERQRGINSRQSACIVHCFSDKLIASGDVLISNNTARPIYTGR